MERLNLQSSNLINRFIMSTIVKMQIMPDGLGVSSQCQFLRLYICGMAGWILSVQT